MKNAAALGLTSLLMRVTRTAFAIMHVNTP
jgi:hypothetical protein